MAKVESFCRSRLNGCGPETRQPVEAALRTLRGHLEEEQAGKEEKATLVNDQALPRGGANDLR